MKTHPLISRFRTFRGHLGPGFEAWFYGVKVRDWLFTGTSKDLRGGPVQVGYPPVNFEYFEWLALMASVVSASSRFTMVECGAGWGRWLAAAAQLARQRNLALCLVGVEAEPSHFKWMEMVLEDNGIEPGERTLCRCAVAPREEDVLFLSQERPAENYGQRVVAAGEVKMLRTQPGCSVETVPGRTLSSLLKPLDSVDLLSVDIGDLGFEVLEEARPILREKVRILQVFTNTAQAHAGVEALLEPDGWLNAFRFPPSQDASSLYGNVHFDQGLHVWVSPKSRAALDLIEQTSVQAPYPIASVPVRAAQGSGGVGVFDSEAAIAINQARLEHLASLGLPIEGRTVLDVGCGVGHLAQFFVQRNCKVMGVDVRPENIISLQGRYPSLAARVLNVETQSLAELGRFEVVFCYGLLYHLENPLAALRNIAAVTSDLLLVETLVSDHTEPVLRLVDESSGVVNQAAGDLACRPTPSFVAMALHRLGFPYVYAPVEPPDHPDFRFRWNNDLEWSRDGHLLRCVFIASRRELDSTALVPLIGGEAGEVGTEQFVPVIEAPSVTRVWIDLGAHLDGKTLAAAEHDPALRVYAFEPDLSIASRLMGRFPNYVVIPMAVGRENGTEQPQIEERTTVPVTRLESFLDRMGIKEVDYLKVEAQAADLAVVRSAGKRLGDIRKISLEVQTTPVPPQAGASDATETVEFLRNAGFELVSIEEQSHGQEENLSFVRARDFALDQDGRMLQRARSLASFWLPVPDPGWYFDAGWNGEDRAVQERRAIWEHFHSSGRFGLLEVEWLDHMKITLYLGNDLSRQLFVLGRFEPNEFALLDRILKPGMCFLDVGANEGLYTLFAAVRLGAAGRVWAFEPSPREFARLRGNCRQNCLDQVRLFRMALSDAGGFGELTVAIGGHAGQNALCEDPNRVPILRRERVPVMRLDDIAQSEGLARLDVLKMDVEGEEFRALHGAEQTVRRYHPVILFECSDPHLRRRGSSALELTNLLRNWGYRLYDFDNATGHPRPLGAQTEAVNLLALPEGFDLSPQS